MDGRQHAERLEQKLGDPAGIGRGRRCCRFDLQPLHREYAHDIRGEGGFRNGDLSSDPGCRVSLTAVVDRRAICSGRRVFLCRKWHARSAYRFCAEVTVYLDPDHTRGGIGSKLYDQLFPILKARVIHTAIGEITLPNEASFALHEEFGFSKVAHFKEVGFKFDRWLDVGYWQRNL